MTPLNYPFTAIPSAEHARPKVYEELDGIKESSSGLVAERVRQFSDSSGNSSSTKHSSLSSMSLSAYGYPSVKRSNAPSPMSVGAKTPSSNRRQDWWDGAETEEPQHSLDGTDDKIEVIKQVASMVGEKYLPAKLRVATPRYQPGFVAPGDVEYRSTASNAALQSVCMGDWESKRKYSGGGETSNSPDKMCKITNATQTDQETGVVERIPSCSTDGLRAELENYCFTEGMDVNETEFQMPMNFFDSIPAQVPPYPESLTNPAINNGQQHVEKPWWKDFQDQNPKENQNAAVEGVRHEEDIRDNRFLRSEETFKDEPSPYRSEKEPRSPRHYNTPFGSLSPAHRGSQYGALVPRAEQGWPLTQEFYESSVPGRDGESQNGAPILIKFLDQRRIDIVEQEETSPTRSSGDGMRPDTIIRVRRGGQRPLVLQFSG